MTAAKGTGRAHARARAVTAVQVHARARGVESLKRARTQTRRTYTLNNQTGAHCAPARVERMPLRVARFPGCGQQRKGKHE